MTPNKYNIHQYFFFFAALFTGLSVLMWKQDFQDPIFNYLWQRGFIPLAILLFIAGLLTMLTRPLSYKVNNRNAIKNANILMKQIENYSTENNLFPNASKKVVRISELIEQLNPHQIHMFQTKLNELHRQIPAILLPDKFDSSDIYIDWHQYDLCIIAANEDVEIAQEIRSELLKHNNDWKIYIEEVDVGRIGEHQELFIKRVFFGSSRYCLALLSIQMINHARRKMELNYAIQRVQYIKEEGYSNYLFPIPLDKYGLAYMQKEKLLSNYANNLEIIQDQKKLFSTIVLKLVKILENGTSRKKNADNKSAGGTDPMKVNTDSGVKIFLSYVDKDEQYRDELAKFLDIIQKMGLITSWSDRKKIIPGTDSNIKVNMDLNEADFILLLISTDYMTTAGDPKRNFEYVRAMELYEAGKTKVIPILVRPTILDQSKINTLQMLPQNKQPVAQWKNLDSAFLDIAKGIMKAIKKSK